jgi:5-methylcytosine-specific restriction endonuclease McrA
MALPLNLPTLAEMAQRPRATAKPSSLARDKKQYDKRQARAKAKRSADRIDDEADRAIRREVRKRDQGRSRFSGTPVKWTSDNPLIVGHAHHIVYRSQGGSDAAFNRVTLTPEEHDMVHHKHPKYVLDILGLDANATLKFVQKDRETGKVFKRVTSPVPAVAA